MLNNYMNLIATHYPQVTYPSLESVCQYLIQILRPGDIAVFRTGNCGSVIPEVMNSIHHMGKTDNRGEINMNVSQNPAMSVLLLDCEYQNQK